MTSGPSFVVDVDSIDPAVFGLSSYATVTAPAPRIDRKSAIQVPAVKRTRDLIAGSLGSLPVELFGPGKVPMRSELLTQPEAGTTRTVSMTALVEDMLFEQTGWWVVTEFGWHNYPVKVHRPHPRTVRVTEGKVYVNDVHVPDDRLIRFDSPNDALLVAGARAIRTCLALEAAAYRNADGTPPMDYFTPAGDVEPDEDDVPKLLAQWQEARRNRSTGYVPGDLKYQMAGWSPEQLQMAEARQHAVLEIARVGGVDPEELGVSTTSRTYRNDFDRRKQFLDFTLGGYISAIQDRLSMNDVTPDGFTARLNLDAFLRTDTLTRYQTYEVGLRVGAIDPAGEVRELEDKPPLSHPAPLPTTAATPAGATPSTVPTVPAITPENLT